ncbi:MAG: hypothetical protein HKN25_11565 [Pyrinomonadaceae bacterium]|nr:hypothetical protein [Pyrinomonadaceae bacterium]
MEKLSDTQEPAEDRPSDSGSGDQTETEDFVDEHIICSDCDKEFVWSAGEQEFFRDKGLQNPPKRCKPCKKAKNARITALNSSDSRHKIEVHVNCAECGANTTVPFYPSQGRPVFCRSCFLRMNPDTLSGHEK